MAFLTYWLLNLNMYPIKNKKLSKLVCDWLKVLIAEDSTQ